MRPVFVGNFEYDTRQSELERLFAKYGRIERVDMKSGKFIVQCCVSLLTGHKGCNLCSFKKEVSKILLNPCASWDSMT